MGQLVPWKLFEISPAALRKSLSFKVLSFTLNVFFCYSLFVEIFSCSKTLREIRSRTEASQGALGTFCNCKNSHLFQQQEMASANIFDRTLERELGGE